MRIILGRRVAGLVATAFFGSCALASLAAAEGPCQEQLQAYVQFYSAAITRRSAEALELLRTGETEQAIEILEEHVLGPGLASLSYADTSKDTTTALTLLHAKRYRAKYPRVHSNPEVESEIRAALAQPVEAPAKLAK